MQSYPTVMAAVYASIDPARRVGHTLFPAVSLELPASAECLDLGGGVPLAACTPEQRAALAGDLEAASATAPEGGAYEAWSEALRRLELDRSEAVPEQESGGLVVLLTDGLPDFTLRCPGSAEDGSPHQQFVHALSEAASTGTRTLVVGLPGSDSAEPPSDELLRLLETGAIEAVYETEASTPRARLGELALAGKLAVDPCCADASAPHHVDLEGATDLASALQEKLTTLLQCTHRVPESPPNIFVNPDDAAKNK